MPQPNWLVPLAALVLASCASVPAPVTRSPESPAHPAAPEAATPPASPELMGKASALPDAHGSHATPSTAPTAGAVYTCPMHADVTSATPGTCPVCGMALVPKKTPKEEPR